MKNFVVIGGSTGIGRALAELLSKEHKVYATFNKTETSDDNIEYHHLNVLDEQLDFSWLPEKIDGLAYCPGSINLKSFKRISPQDFTNDYELQVVGAIKVLQAALGQLKKAGKASVVLFSTVAVQMGFNFHSQVAASKGAIEGLTRALAAELAPNIRVNCVAPSLTNTPLAAKLLSSEEKIQANAKRHPLQEIGTAQDSAEMAAFLLTDVSKWMTGQVLHLDGGVSSIKS